MITVKPLQQGDAYVESLRYRSGRAFLTHPESALVKDFRDLLEKLAPADQPTRHGDTWGDDNGFSHRRASLMGPGVTLPLVDGSLLLGTWQQIVVVDHDNRPRDRRIRVQVVGE